MSRSTAMVVAFFIAAQIPTLLFTAQSPAIAYTLMISVFLVFWWLSRPQTRKIVATRECAACGEVHSRGLETCPVCGARSS